MPDPNRLPPARSPRFQFSLYWMLVAVTAIAVTIGIAMTFGSVMSATFFALVCCVLPTPLLICAIFGRGDVQAFAVGALVPWVMLTSRMSYYSTFHLVAWLLFLPAMCGVIAVFTRRWIRPFD